METYNILLVLFSVFMCNVLLINAEDKVNIEVTNKVECTKKSKNDDYLKVHYTGYLKATGDKFDSSLEKGEPFEFQLGKGEVIKGWEHGLKDMCAGEKRTLSIPASLAYGDKGAGKTIPGGAALKFDIELLSIEDAPKPNNVFKDIDKDGDGLLSQDEVRGFLAKQMGGAGSMPGDSGQDMMEQMVKEFIRIQDTNKDGVISPREFAKPTHGPKDEL